MAKVQSRPSKLLVIDDDPETLLLVQDALSKENLEILTATGPEAGLVLFFKHRPRIVVLDLMMPKMSGMQVLEKMVAADPGVDVILATSHYSTDSAVEAIQKGACDYLTKPLDFNRLRTRIRSLVEEAQKRERTAELDRELLDASQFEGMIGRSPLMLDVFAKIRRVAPHFRTVLVSGMTGTGKELVARALHRQSPVADGPFAVLNCSSLVETLIESELFGYVRGAFTGANQDKIGIFESANGGTVLLDEIGEMATQGQAKLLRVLQNQEVRRVGSATSRSINIRVIAATNRNLRNEVARGAFREDLYYRLATVEIKLPRLADRKEDLPLLERHLLSKFATEYGREIRGLTRRAQAHLASHSWPGNVRELENVLGNACMMVQGDIIDLPDLPEYLGDITEDLTSEETDSLPLTEVQRRHVLRVLKKLGGNKTRAAEVLGIGRATLYEMLARMKPGEETGSTETVIDSSGSEDPRGG
jgi:DNA-binding NtrC family response regulator